MYRELHNSVTVGLMATPCYGVPSVEQRMRPQGSGEAVANGIREEFWWITFQEVRASAMT